MESTETKHTPGPWSVTDPKQNKEWEQIQFLRATLVAVKEEFVFGGNWESAKKAIDRALNQTGK